MAATSAPCAGLVPIAEAVAIAWGACPQDDTALLPTGHTLHLLASSICSLVSDAERGAADLWLINTCTVKSPRHVVEQQRVAWLCAADASAGHRWCWVQAVPQCLATQALSGSSVVLPCLQP